MSGQLGEASARGNRVLEAVVSDAQIGTSLWQQAMLEKIGVTTKIVSLSAHAHFAPKRTMAKGLLFRLLKFLPRWLVRLWFAKSKFASVRWVVCSIPPKRVNDFLKLPDSVRILLNVGHRFQIHMPPSQQISAASWFQEVAKSSRVTLASMSEYDFHYIRYHTGIETYKLPVSCEHLGVETTGGAPATKTEILVGPINQTKFLSGFDLASLNRLADSRSVNGRTLRFVHVRDIAEDGDVAPEQLASYSAIVVFPYSAFSISMVEAYQQNLPFFAPSDELLIGQMEDVRLYPNYASKDIQEAIAAAAILSGKAQGYAFSPHSTSSEAEAFWLKFMYFNQVKNAVRFDSPEQLVDLLNDVDLVELRERMRLENEEHRHAQRALWQKLVTQDGEV